MSKDNEFDALAKKVLLNQNAQLPTELAQTGTILNELYCSWIEAGFTEQQALWLTGVVVAGTSFGAPPPGVEQE